MQKVVFSIAAGAWLDLLLQGGKLPPKFQGSWCILLRLWSRQVQGCPLGRRWGASLVPGGAWSRGGQAKSYLCPLAEPPAQHIHQSREGPAPTARYNPMCEGSAAPWGPPQGFTLIALAASEHLAVRGDGKRLEYKYVKYNTDGGLRLRSFNCQWLGQRLSLTRVGSGSVTNGAWSWALAHGDAAAGYAAVLPSFPGGCCRACLLLV